MAGIDYRKLVLLASLPEGWSGTPQAFAEILVERLRVLLSEEGGINGTLQFGGTEPPSDQSVLWIDNASDTASRARPQLKIYDKERAKYAAPYYIPVGALVPFAGASTDHPDWVECDNRKLLVADYPELYAAIGNLWGGTTSVDFYVPDMRGRVAMGANGSTTGAGVDWAGDKGNLLERTMGSDGPDAEGAGTDAPGNHPGYPGHDFAFNTAPSSNRPKKPKGQWLNLEPVTGSKILSGVQPSTVLRWFIKAR